MGLVKSTPSYFGGGEDIVDRSSKAKPLSVNEDTQPRSGQSRLARAIAEIKADARIFGLTDQEIDQELAAYNSEHRNHDADD